MTDDHAAETAGVLPSRAMSWLASLDAKSRRWPAVIRWSYHAIKWLLIAVGAYATIGTAYIEVFQEHRLGLGSGIVVAFLLATIKGILGAITASPAKSDPHQSD